MVGNDDAEECGSGTAEEGDASERDSSAAMTSGWVAMRLIMSVHDGGRGG